MNIIDPIPSHQCVAVFGLGCSGLAAAHLLRRLGKRVIASDCADETKRDEFLSKLPPSTELFLGRNAIGSATAIVTSPGLEPSLPIFALAAERNIPILAELELAANATQTPIIAITGTDGKTTTTSLAAHLLAQCGLHSSPCGNIGIPMAQALLQHEAHNDAVDCFVVETSAFQLAFCQAFHPTCLIATNIAEDHNEYFKGDTQAYVATKRRMLPNMTRDDLVVLNASDPEIRTWNTWTNARVCYYAESQRDLPPEASDFAYFDGTNLNFAFQGESFRFPFELTMLRGRHNAMNAMAAVLAARAKGRPFDRIVDAFRSYELPHHRIEYVCTRNGVDFIDDSKATNPHAAIAALKTLREPTILIVGGVDKGLQLEPWLKEMTRHVKCVIAIGELTERFCREAKNAVADLPIRQADTLQDAVELAYKLALAHACKVVLLSPGCSSYDMFENYAQRGDIFAQTARNLENS